MEEIRHIGAVDTVRVLANEERLRLLRLLMKGPATLTQLGAAVEHHPAWVRHHVLSLEQAGLVELVETRPTKGYVEKFYCATARAYAVDFVVLPDEGERGLLVILGSDDRALDLLAQRLRERAEGPDVITMAMGSLEGLIALRHGIGHVAGCHLFDAQTGDFNISHARALFPGRALVLVTLAHRQQGLIVPAGNPRGLKDLAEAASAGARLINRNRGSGTRVWLDRLLAGGDVDPFRVAGYETEVVTHDAAARAVAEGAADVALGILPAATAYGLDFVPLVEERYDLVIPREHYESAVLAPLLDLVKDDSFKQAIEDLGGYVTRETGAVTALG
ncbi:MAG: helix-turn-helix domain-containing protein [Actinobacteria bacterium]|nr:helix-turn-helix domain-containing protein [Actinomycetota bacterium]